MILHFNKIFKDKTWKQKEIIYLVIKFMKS